MKSPKSSGYRESVAKKMGIHFTDCSFLEIFTHGEINDISVLDPLPGLVGLIKVVSTIVQPSPKVPQLPGR